MGAWTRPNATRPPCPSFSCSLPPCYLVVQLLGELLLDRSNVKVMLKFVSDVQHLMTMMVLLKDQSRSIQFEAFHVFKVWYPDSSKT